MASQEVDSDLHSCEYWALHYQQEFAVVLFHFICSWMFWSFSERSSWKQQPKASNKKEVLDAKAGNFGLESLQW